MEKIKKIKKFKEYNTSVLLNEFRDLVDSKLGVLDTATSFMYLYRRFGDPNMNCKDDYKILYEYEFNHEDLLFTVHASYHKYVYFSIGVPKVRLKKWFNNRKKFFRQLYNKYKNNVFMPYKSLFFQIPLTKNQSQKNWKLFFNEVEKSLSKEECRYIESQLQSEQADIKVFEMLEPIEEKLYESFKSKLTETECSELYKNIPKLEDIENLKEQCEFVIDEFLKGVYIRDVLINIKGYESESNKITDYIE
jgi:hypothetical protein